MKIISRKKVFWLVIAFLLLPLSSSLANGISIPNLIDAEDAGGLIEIIIVYFVGIIGSLGVLALVIAGLMYLFAGVNEGALRMAKGFFYGAILGIGLAAAGPTLLKEIKVIVLGKGGKVPTTINTARSLTEIVSSALTQLLLIFGILAIIGLVIGAIMYLAAMGNPSQAERATTMVRYSIVGIGVAGGSIILVQQIANFF